MTPVRVPHNAFILSCDGAKAVIMCNHGDSDLLDLRVVETLAEPHPRTHQLGAQRPGRTYESLGSRRSAVEQSDLHDDEETQFLNKVAKRIDTLAHKEGVKDLIVLAPPRSLGVLRNCYTEHLRSIIKNELPKDLTHLSIREIEQHLMPTGKTTAGAQGGS